MNTAQKWLGFMAGLGALGLVLANPKGVMAFGKATKNVVGGTERQIIRAGNNS